MAKQQSSTIKDAITKHLASGVTDKQEIYTLVVKELGVPRPTVRRVAGSMRREISNKIAEHKADLEEYQKQLADLS